MQLQTLKLYLTIFIIRFFQKYVNFISHIKNMSQYSATRDHPTFTRLMDRNTHYRILKRKSFSLCFKKFLKVTNCSNNILTSCVIFHQYFFLTCTCLCIIQWLNNTWDAIFIINPLSPLLQPVMLQHHQYNCDHVFR